MLNTIIYSPTFFSRKSSLNLEKDDFNTEVVSEEAAEQENNIGFICAKDGNQYKYNVEVNGIYYCPNNVIINSKGDIIQLDEQEYLLIDNYILDYANKKITTWDPQNEQDGFVASFGEIEKIDIVRLWKNERELVINSDGKLSFDEEIVIKLNNENQLTGYYNPNIETITDFFLFYNTEIKFFSAPNLKKIQKCFLPYNKKLRTFDAPELQFVGKFFLDSHEYKDEILTTSIEGNDFWDFQKNNKILKSSIEGNTFSK